MIQVGASLIHSSPDPQPRPISIPRSCHPDSLRATLEGPAKAVKALEALLVGDGAGGSMAIPKRQTCRVTQPLKAEFP